MSSNLWGETRHRRDRYTGCLAVEPLDTATSCPECGATTVTGTLAEPALFRHGGYGADRTTGVRYCSDSACRWTLTAEVSEARPLREGVG